VIAELAVGPEGLAIPGTERVLLTIVQDFSNNNGGHLAFGPDGYLYIGMGDGGSGNDPCNRAQTLDPSDLISNASCRDHITAALLGKMLRIDVDSVTVPGENNLCGGGTDGSSEYAVPATNPFINEAACAEVWSLGFRNPWRFSFDRQLGELWIADVGQNTWEEVNLEPVDVNGGVNYGWSICEGNYAAGSTDQHCPLQDSTLPVLTYPSAGGDCAVIGGYRYRGPVVNLDGLYVFGDWCSGRIWLAADDGQSVWLPDEFSVEGFGLQSFSEDLAGRLYLIRSSGVWLFDGDSTAPDPTPNRPASISYPTSSTTNNISIDWSPVSGVSSYELQLREADIWTHSYSGGATAP
jgi:hypothetical protein